MRQVPVFPAMILAALACFAPLGWAQGGPPFRSDDPDTPGKGHWEINGILTADRNPSEGAYETPNVDINYGLGNRIQLKYEVPLSVHESRDSGEVASGLGNSLLGVKWRMWAHHPRSETTGEIDKSESNFGISIYPQLLLNNYTHSVRRDLVDRGPQFLMPVELNARWGPLRMSAECGYWFTNKSVPNSWIQGIILGHEFGKKTEIDVELYDQDVIHAIGDNPRTRETTIGFGGRTPITKAGWLWFMGMVGRSIATITPTNGQPSWIATFGVQYLSEQRRRHSRE